MKYLSLFFVLLPTLVYSKFVPKESLSYIVNDFTITVSVVPNGSFIVQNNIEYTVQTQSAVKMFSNYRNTYNAGTTTVKFFSAHVKNTEGITYVKADKFKTRTLSTRSEFDEMKEWSIALPNVKIGTVISLSYSTMIKNESVPQQFFFDYYLPDLAPYIEKGRFIFISPMQIFVAAGGFNTGSMVPRSSWTKGKPFTFELVKPYYGQLDELSSAISDVNVPAIFASTTKSWDSIQKNYASRFDISINSSLPPELEAIIVQGKQRTQLKDRLEFMLKYMHETFSFAGSERTIKGKFAPRIFSQMYSKKMINDYELTSLLVLYLRRLGYVAHPAIVYKGAPLKTHMRTPLLPHTGFFNSAIVKLEADGETYWIDPTVYPSMGLNHSQEIAEKPVLVLNKPDLEVIPAKTPDESKTLIQYTYDLMESKEVQVSAEVLFQGPVAFSVLSASSMMKKEFFEKRLLWLMGSQDHFVFSSYDLKNATYRPLTFKASGRVSGLVQKNDEGEYLTVPGGQDLYPLFLGSFSDWVGDLFVGGPETVKRVMTFKNIKLADKKIQCSIQSQWLDVERTSVVLKNSLVVTDIVTKKGLYIYNMEFRTKDFSQLVEKLKKCSAPEKFYLSRN